MSADNGSRLCTLIFSARGAKWHTYIYARTCKHDRSTPGFLNSVIFKLRMTYFVLIYVSYAHIRDATRPLPLRIPHLIKPTWNLRANFSYCRFCNAAKRVRF